MAERRARRQVRSEAAPYDVDNGRASSYDLTLPDNWTTTQLKAELTKLNVKYNNGDRRATLVRKFKAARQSANVQEISGSEITNNGGAHLTEVSNVSTSQSDLSFIVQSITTLTNTVTKLQDELRTVSQHVHRPGTSAAAGSEAQLHQQVAERELQGGLRTENSVTTQPEEGFTLMTARGSSTPGTSHSSTGSVTNPRFGYAIESLPFIETVSPKLRKAIIEGKDVNLAQLLIPTSNAVNMSEKEHSCDKEDKYDKDPRLHKTLSIAEFIYAFGIYKNIMCQTYPNRREELNLYERDIVDMATHYGGKGFYEYHKTFSARAAAHLRYIFVFQYTRGLVRQGQHPIL